MSVFQPFNVSLLTLQYLSFNPSMSLFQPFNVSLSTLQCLSFNPSNILIFIHIHHNYLQIFTQTLHSQIHIYSHALVLTYFVPLLYPSIHFSSYLFVIRIMWATEHIRYIAFTNHIFNSTNQSTTYLPVFLSIFSRNNVGDPVINMVRRIIDTFPEITCIFLNCDLVRQNHYSSFHV